MIHPSISDLTNNGEINRYTLVIVAAKCARIITDEYVKQKEYAEKLASVKEPAKRSQVNELIKKEYIDEKAVKVAINGLYDGEFRVTGNDGEEIRFGRRTEEESEEAEAEADEE